MVLAVFHRKDQPENIISRNQFLLKYVSVGVWTMMLFHLVSLAGSAKVPLAILLIVLMMLGVVTDKTNKECENGECETWWFECHCFTTCKKTKKTEIYITIAMFYYDELLKAEKINCKLKWLK